MIKISVVIPTHNEAGYIERLVKHLLLHAPKGQVEVIVADGGSTDSTASLASHAGAVVLESAEKGRAAQMNFGAARAAGDVLYFVHADALPPKSYYTDIAESIKSGYDCGRYITRFDTAKWYLRLNAFFTRFDWLVCYGGDQTLYVTQTFFHEVGGFSSEMQIMEDLDFTARLRGAGGRYKILKKGVLVSDRKYDKNSWWQVQSANARMVRMYKGGASQERMAATYAQMLKRQ